MITYGSKKTFVNISSTGASGESGEIWHLNFFIISTLISSSPLVFVSLVSGSKSGYDGYVERWCLSYKAVGERTCITCNACASQYAFMMFLIRDGKEPSLLRFGSVRVLPKLRFGSSSLQAWNIWVRFGFGSVWVRTFDGFNFTSLTAHTLTTKLWNGILQYLVQNPRI